MSDQSQHRELFFSSMYTPEQARRYYDKHRSTFSRRLSHRVEERMARRALALAGDPASVLDLPCGAGRFWPLLAERPERELLAADYSQGMLEVAKGCSPPELARRFALVRTSAFRIGLADEAVESIFCMRLLHHIGDPADRARMLREFHRVTAETLIVSLWVDGNWQGWRRKRLEAARASGRREYRRRYHDRFVQPRRRIEAEFRQAGFEILGAVDFLPLWSIWRTYVLKKR